MNNASTDPYNADFDGDEMNLALLVVNQNTEGAKILCSFEYRMTNLSDNTIVL